MGDNEAARSLLNEVMSGGNGAQKQEAETLLKRLGG
jgi:FimV-like protein